MVSLPYINRRRFLQTGTALALGGSLSACDIPFSKTEIVYWDSFVDLASWFNTEIQLFEQDHPGIAVRRVVYSPQQYDETYARAVHERHAPDVALVPRTPAFIHQVQRGWYQSFDPWATQGWKQRYPAGTFHEGNNIFDGKVYSAPFLGKTPWLQLYMNNAVFTNAGLVNEFGEAQQPKTWDDVTHMAETITQKSSGKTHALGLSIATLDLLPKWLHLFVLGAGSTGGAYEMDHRVGRYTYGRDRNYLDWFQLWLEWKEKGYINPDALNISEENLCRAFTRGSIGMIVGDSSYQSNLRQKYNFNDFTMATLISPEATPKAYFPSRQGGYFFVMSAQTIHPEEAWQWLDWIYSEEAGRRWVAAGYDLSIFEKSNNPAVFSTPTFAQYATLAKYVLPAPDVCVRNPATCNILPEPVTPDIRETMASIYKGEIEDIQTALSELEGRMQSTHEDAIKKAQEQGLKVTQDDYKFPDWDPTKPYYHPTNKHSQQEPRKNS